MMTCEAGVAKASHQGFCRLLLAGLKTSQNSRTLLRLAHVVAAADAVRSTTVISSVIVTEESCEQKARWLLRIHEPSYI